MNAEAYISYLDALNFKDDDIVCISFGRTGTKIWEDFFTPFKALRSDAAIAKLAARNDEGQNIYISMAPFVQGTTSRKKEYVAGVRHVFADDDEHGPETLALINADAAAGTMPSPDIAIESSPGKVQVIWHVNGDFDVAKQEALNRAIQQRYKTDPATTDTARVLRVAGFKNHKYESKPEARVLHVGGLIAQPRAAFKIAAAVEVKASPSASIDGPKIPRGQHDTELHRIAGKLRHAGAEEEAIYNALVEIVEKRCENYGSDYLEMCRKHAHNICKKPVGADDTVLIGGRPAGEGSAYANATTIEVDPEKLKAEVVAAAVAAAAAAAAPLVYVDGDQFMAEDIPPRRVLLRTKSKGEPVFFQQSINQIFAWRGTGKTNVGLGLTMAFATAGSLLNWTVPERSRVLYIEGELPGSQIQERWKAIVGLTGGYAHLVTIDKQPSNVMPKLSTKIGMDKVEATLAALAAEGHRIDVLMLDSISTLFNVSANDEDVWLTIQDWLISLRSRGLTIIFFHHSGKGGMSRSHSKSEDMLDVSVKLEAPENKESGCLHAIMSYDKVRAGLDEPAAEIKMHRTHSEECACRKSSTLVWCPGDGVNWEYKVLGEELRYEAEILFEKHVPIRDIAQMLGVGKSTVGDWKKRWSALHDKKKIIRNVREVAEEQGESGEDSTELVEGKTNDVGKVNKAVKKSREAANAGNR